MRSPGRQGCLGERDGSGTVAGGSWRFFRRPSPRGAADMHLIGWLALAAADELHPAALAAAEAPLTQWRLTNDLSAGWQTVLRFRRARVLLPFTPRLRGRALIGPFRPLQTVVGV